MKIDYTITLNYGDDAPGDDEPSPTEEDIVSWIVVGMEIDGFTSVNVTCKRRWPLPRKPKPKSTRSWVTAWLGTVGLDLTVTRPMVKAKGHIVQLIGPDGKTMKTLTVSTIGHHE
jgi:hypothetical protein